MSRQIGAYLVRLENQAKPNKNDERHGQYVKWTNAYSAYFGKDKAYLVGSTTEGLKLRSRHQGGDADFLISSGKLKIPVESLEHREATPCYVRVKADQLPAAFRDDVVEGYLSADLVRQVNPKLFTTLRAVFTIATMTSDSVPGRTSRVTKIALPMKVGTAVKEFRNLEIEGIDSSEFRRKRRRLTQSRNSHVAAQLRRRWSIVRRVSSDSAIIRRILDVFTDLKVPGSRGHMFGQLNNFATLLNSVLGRPPLGANAEEDQEFNNDLNEEDTERTFRATYSDMTSKDFVPAVKIASDRKMECMIAWYERVKMEAWPPKDLVEEIYNNTELFLVARDAPIDPDHRKDFCISFNVAELKLSKRLTAVQRRVYLILKSYLNGVLKKTHENLGIELKLKTYYLKTALFWVCEKESPSIWSDIIGAVKKVLDYLLQRLAQKNLRHYFFVHNNLFAEMSNIDFDVLRECIQEIKMDPVYSIEEFFTQDAKERAVVWLTEEEVRSIQRMREDGGDQEAMDKLEDALIDIQRGFNKSRDENGEAPIKLAIMRLLDMFFEDERAREAEQAASNISLGGATCNIQPNASPQSLISDIIGSIVTSGGKQPVDRQRVGQVTDFLHFLSPLAPPEISQHVANFGGRSGIESVVAQQGVDKEEQRRNIRDVTERYLSCPDERVESVRMELKQIYAGYFLGRPE